VTDIRTLFCDSADATASLLAEPALNERFDQASALAEFSVRGLAGHRLRAMTSVERYVDDPEPAGAERDAVSAAGYYAGTVEPGGDLGSDFHRAIRQRGEEAAPAEPQDFPALWADTAGRLRARLAAETPDRLVQVYGGLVLTLDAYLVTRLIELVVHADDLAVSLGVSRPPLPPAADALVITTLVDVARLRHGDAAVVRALTRRERDPGDALRVL
jgi:uncharacterized protein (TIGR03083 family)